MIVGLIGGRIAETVTWVKFPRPTFDLVGVVLGSLSLAGLCAVVTAALGGALGLAFIVRGRRHPPRSRGDAGLRLVEPTRS